MRPAPRDALFTWLGELAAGSTTYQGLPETIMSALADDNSRLHATCGAMRTGAGQLLHRAQQSGTVRADVTVSEVITRVIGLAWAAEHSDDPLDLTARLLSTAIHGLGTTGEAAGP